MNGAAPGPTFGLQRLADVPPDDGWLSERERAVVAGLSWRKRRDDWRLGRWTAKCVLASVLGALPPQRIAVIAAANGAPEVWVDDARAPYTISISHAGGLGLVALGVAATPLGCDVERVEPRSAIFVADYFTLAERTLVAEAPAETRTRLVTMLWSAKESVLKALGEGLRLDTRAVDVAPGQAALCGWAAFTATATGPADRYAGWWQPCGPFVLTLAGRPPFGVPCPAAEPARGI